MNLTRREIKFQIPLSMVDPISRFAERYCDLDKYSLISDDRYYVINTLYLDNDAMYLLSNKRANLPQRYSMRIRSYGYEPRFPAFMEIKTKVDQMINKRRCAITRLDTLNYLETGMGGEDNPDLEQPVMRHACYNVIRLGLTPKMMTQYRRKAYMGRYEPYSRLTFDKQMRCYPESKYTIFPRLGDFMNYDHAEQYTSDDVNVVLELKCELKVPGWMLELIRRFELRQEQFSKFDSSWTFLTDKQIEHQTFDLGQNY